MNLKAYIKTWPVTCSFLVLIVFLYLMMTLKGGSRNNDVLIAFGANYYPGIVNGEYWRLIACNFLHAGAMHLVLNSVALLSLGGLAETLLRRVKYILLILLSGLASSLASLWFNLRLHPNVPSVGASGAVFGIVGAIMIYAWKDPRFRSTGMTSSLIILVVINLAFGLSMENIDNAAHIGGLLAGLMIGGVFRLMSAR